MDPKYKEHLSQKLYEKHKEKSKEELELESKHDIDKILTKKERKAKGALNGVYFKIQYMHEHFEIKGKLGHSMVVEKHLLTHTVEYNNFDDLYKLIKKAKKALDEVRAERSDAAADPEPHTNVIVDSDK